LASFFRKTEVGENTLQMGEYSLKILPVHQLQAQQHPSYPAEWPRRAPELAAPRVPGQGLARLFIDESAK